MNNKAGFSLLEIIIVIALIAITLSVVIPGFKRKNANIMSQFGQEINNLMRKAYLNAIETNKIQKIYFDIKRNTVAVQQESGHDKATGERLFSAIKSSRFKLEFKLNKFIEFRNFYISTPQGIKDQMTQSTNDVWFFITSDGIAQSVVINVVDTRDNSLVPQAGFVLNPFTLVFEQHAEFQKL